MILLTGKSLNERHRELNNKVNEAVTQEVLFDDVKLQPEKTDVDRLYKIKLADKYRNVEYIVDTLKCGDNLYITKALKCAWLCDEEFSNIINPDYLESNIFTEMSYKMKRKFLTMISMHVTNDRAATFYKYCIHIKLPNIAVKFLLNTTEAFKNDFIKGRDRCRISDENMIQLIGNSISLAVTLLDNTPAHSIVTLLYNLRYLYSVSDVEYLNIVEKYLLKYDYAWNKRVGLRISKHIIKNHKDRLIRHTPLYIHMLNKSILIKYSSPDDVKNYAPRLLTARLHDFWDDQYYKRYKYLFEIIPLQERLPYIRTLFTTQYPGREFEMNINFYHAELHTLMTKEERESWALKHVEQELEHFGTGKDYLWYKFVSFDKALVAIKKYILVAADTDTRNEIVRVLVHSAQSNRELEILFNYYYQRHVNEITRYKELFVNEVFSNHKYFDFDDDCWNAFNKILHSMDVYDHLKAYGCNGGYKMKALIYYIIHEKELLVGLKKYIEDGVYMYGLKQETDQLPDGKAEVVYQYLFNFYLEKIREFNINEYNEDMKSALRTYINDILNLMYQYDKPKNEIPEIVMKYIQLDLEEYANHFMIQDNTEIPFTPGILLKDLKNDASLVLSKIPKVRTALKEDSSFRLNKLLRKLRVYFSTDIAEHYVKLFKELIMSEDTSEQTCNMAIYGIIQIAETSERIDLVTQFTPTESKISHDEIERNLLYVRKAICKTVCMSRPDVPLLYVKKYIVGDYLKFCMPLIQSYAANLQPSLFIDFIKLLLTSPASIQKHGIRLAFQQFSIKELKKIMSDIWKSSKNISLRLVIYKALYKKIIDEPDADLQKELFETFNTFTLDLREDDDDGLYHLVCTSNLPNHVLGEHILSAWKSLNILPDKRKFIQYKANIVDNMARCVNLMQQDVIESIVSEHITFMLKQENIKTRYDNSTSSLIKAKWNLTAQYLVYFPDESVEEQKMRMMVTIIKECIRLWDKTDGESFIMRAFTEKFIENVRSSILLKKRDSCMYGIRLLEQMLKELAEALPLIQIYETVWSLRLTIIVGNILAAVNHDNDILSIFDDSIDKFATEFRNLLNEFIDQGKYYISGQDGVLSIFRNIVNSLRSALPYIDHRCIDGTYANICYKLVDTDKFEVYYFVVSLLPNSYQSDWVFYRSTIHKIKSFKNDEIQHFLYRKMVRENNYDYHFYN